MEDKNKPFWKDLARSERINKDILYPYYESEGYKILTVDNLDYQSAGIDILLLRDNRLKAVEIKADFYPAKNVIFERLNTKTNNPGWISKTLKGVDYWVHYFFVNESKLVTFNMPSLQAWWDGNNTNYPILPMRNQDTTYSKVPLVDIPKSSYRLFYLGD